MNEQLSLFDYMPKAVHPGEYVTEHGKELTFDELAEYVGRAIIISCHTESHDWYKAVEVEEIRIVVSEGCRRLVYFDGHKQRGLVNEYYFASGGAKDDRYATRVYEVG